MRINNSVNAFNNISNMFNILHQGKVNMFAVQLSNSKALFPENKAPGAGMGADTVSYINDLKTGSKDLSDALRSLSGAAFNQRGVVSSNTDAMSVKFTGSSLNSFNDLSIQIDQIARGQLNEGAELRSSQAYSGNRGVNRFAIDVGGRTTNLSISVSATDTNRDVQDKMANAINNAGLGLRATVETDKDTGTSVLRVESQNTGSDPGNEFTIRDLAGSNAVATTGANERTHAGQDAIYSVNGGSSQTSASNTVALAGGVVATFRAATDEPVTVTRGRDTSAAIGAVKDMVDGFNRLFGAAAGNTADPKAQGLASRLMNVFSVYSRSLSEVGIGINNDGRMTIDSDRLARAAEDGSLERLFTQDRGRNFGMVNQFSRVANDVFNNTSNFVSSSVFGSPSDIFGYPGFSNPAQMNAARAGSIFDFQF